MTITLTSPIPGAAFSSDGFGARAPIVTPGGTSGAFHYGQDIDVPAGTPILACAAGQVIASGWIGTYGYAVYVDHGGGIVTRYAHMLAPPPVGSGWHVEQGERIGFVGSTGASTGAHLHWEVVVNGTRVDPLTYLSNHPTNARTGQEEDDEMTRPIAIQYSNDLLIYDLPTGEEQELNSADSVKLVRIAEASGALLLERSVVRVDKSWYDSVKAQNAARRARLARAGK